MKHKFHFFPVLIAIILSSCSKSSEIKDSTFLTDPENPNLPIYSEWGYNTFGAYYDREIFISNNTAVPLKIIETNDTTSFLFRGQKGYYSGSADMSLTLKFADFLPQKYNDLIVLNDTIIDLVNSNCIVSFTINSSSYKTRVIGGHIRFKRAQNLIIDTEPVEVILSGTFDFQLLVNNEPIAISDGRFDFGIREHNFYNY